MAHREELGLQPGCLFNLPTEGNLSYPPHTHHLDAFSFLFFLQDSLESSAFLVGSTDFASKKSFAFVPQESTKLPNSKQGVSHLALASF